MISVPIFIYAGNLVGLLRNDVVVIEMGTRALRLMCAGQLFIPLTMMVEMGFQSMGEKLLATISSSLRSGLIFIPVLLLLAQVRGLAGVQEAQPVSFVISFLICVYFCKLYFMKLRA